MTDPIPKWSGNNLSNYIGISDGARTSSIKVTVSGGARNLDHSYEIGVLAIGNDAYLFESTGFGVTSGYGAGCF